MKKFLFAMAAGYSAIALWCGTPDPRRWGAEIEYARHRQRLADGYLDDLAQYGEWGDMPYWGTWCGWSARANVCAEEPITADVIDIRRGGRMVNRDPASS